jgi:diaminopimelate epimerase
MNKIDFIKMSGLGNDFVIIDARERNYEFLPNLIIKIANRKNIGCDQLILLKNSLVADISIEIYNVDSSKSGACGNATRCVAGLLMKEKNLKKVSIETVSGILQAWIDNNLIAVNMGKPKFDWPEIPLSTKIDSQKLIFNRICQYQFGAVNIGNPHIVTFIKQSLSDKEFFTIAPQLEIHPLFVQKTNIEFAQILSLNHIKVRVWERGVGETMACGSGACAVAILAIKQNLIPRQKTIISFKGGDLFIDWLKDDSTIMIGDYQKIFSGTIDESFL